jgi:hypothetical protein
MAKLKNIFFISPNFTFSFAINSFHEIIPFIYTKIMKNIRQKLGDQIRNEL